MEKKRIILGGRPFQPFLLAADDLLQLAYPYFKKIEESRKNYEKTGEVNFKDRNAWQLDKSLSIGSFMAKYAGLEAFINCAYNEFKINSVEDIPVSYFIGVLKKQRNGLVKKNFYQWHLGSRVYFIAPLCVESMFNPSKIFDITNRKWNKFLEIIEIRNSFNHAKNTGAYTELTSAGPMQWMANDDFPENYWPLTKVYREHRTFNYQAAKDIGEIIDWIINKLRNFIPDLLNEEFMTKEKVEILKE